MNNFLIKDIRVWALSIPLMAACAVSAVSAKAQTALPQPVVVDTPMVHDPVMAYENGKYYLYCTGHGVAQMTSTDRQHWTLNPQGVLKDEGCLISSKGGRDNWNAIDPNFVIDEKGKPWLTWGSFWDGIQLIPLDKKTMHVKKGAKPQTIARRYALNQMDVPTNPTSRDAGTNAIEAPFIMKHGGYYYLFVSWDYCCQGMKSTYRVAVGRSRKVAGPYLDKEGKDMRNGGGTLLLEGDKKEYEAMGHCSAYSFPDGDFFFCHGYSVPKNGASILVQKKINWTEDGWLTLE